MNKLDLARSLAKRSHRSHGEAADDVDTLVHRMLKRLQPPTNEAARPERLRGKNTAAPRPPRER